MCTCMCVSVLAVCLSYVSVCVLWRTGGVEPWMTSLNAHDELLRIQAAQRRVQVRVLQCVAVCCSVLQCAAVCCSVLQCAAVCCSVLQCVEVALCRCVL